jgi:hypothetical protein
MRHIALLLTAAITAVCVQPAGAAGKPSPEIAPRPVLEAMKQVADWQLAQPAKHKTDDWTYGALYAGMMALSQVADSPKYHDAMMAMGRQHG